MMDILIAGMIISGLPGSAEWAIGLLVGINLLFGGATADRHGARRAQGRLTPRAGRVFIWDDKHTFHAL